MLHRPADSQPSIRIEERMTNIVAETFMQTADEEPVQDPSFNCRYVGNPYTTTGRTEETEHDA